eukprot:TRINITY_DN49907_c0_g1_i1.p1 TRINITY_DN49907_c0_g1~~TRINITY_DN49907_c0_g1_i1.p1  ORF type:complete len:542 (+),score=73.88 TRINITY_DN49907_c0_g1_i1:54-1628(+)
MAMHHAGTAASDPRGSVVKLFNTSQPANWMTPWQSAPIESNTGSGALISLPADSASTSGSSEVLGVLTAAHVVANTRFLQVQRSSDMFSSEKLQARVAALCHEADLALLFIEGLEVLHGSVPLKVAGADRLPYIFDRVRVCGYPVGSSSCSITEGVVSRIEVQEYSHSMRAALALTVDAAINSGNSGGPLLDASTGEVIGVAIQKLVAQGVELQGHAVPAPLICWFLSQAANAKTAQELPLSVRMPTLACDMQATDSPALRRSIGLGMEQSGLLVLQSLCRDPDSGLVAGDVLLAFDGLRLDSQGFCEVLGRRLHFSAARDLHCVGESVTLTVWRDRHEIQLTHILQEAQHLVSRAQFDCLPSFFLCGGLVFQPLSLECMQGWGVGYEAPHLQDLFWRGRVKADNTEIVILTQILADEVNQGYGSGYVGAPVVRAINGKAVCNLNHLIETVQHARVKEDATISVPRGFLRFDLEGAYGPWCIVLPLGGLDEADVRVSELYGAPNCSAKLGLGQEQGAGVPHSRL